MSHWRRGPGRAKEGRGGKGGCMRDLRPLPLSAGWLCRAHSRALWRLRLSLSPISSSNTSSTCRGGQGGCARNLRSRSLSVGWLCRTHSRALVKLRLNLSSIPMSDTRRTRCPDTRSLRVSCREAATHTFPGGRGPAMLPTNAERSWHSCSGRQPTSLIAAETGSLSGQLVHLAWLLRLGAPVSPRRLSLANMPPRTLGPFEVSRRDASPTRPPHTGTTGPHSRPSGVSCIGAQRVLNEPREQGEGVNEL